MSSIFRETQNSIYQVAQSSATKCSGYCEQSVKCTCAAICYVQIHGLLLENFLWDKPWFDNCPSLIRHKSSKYLLSSQMCDSVSVWNSTLAKHYVLFGGVEAEGSHEVRDLVHWDGGRYLSHSPRLHPLAANNSISHHQSICTQIMKFTLVFTHSLANNAFVLVHTCTAL